MRSKRRQNGLSGGNHTAALPLMWLGDFETAVFAGSKRRHHVPAQFCRSLRSIGPAVKADPISALFFRPFLFNPDYHPVNLSMVY
ncbi:MAG: hypothetical protein ABF676_03410 [Schleiferilactobacillus harbinensis]|nr:hypothetical protein [Schleiferilactobacillus harbinensis]MCI1688582.1 hypothetical protein [Schleiferilactobacillus harbinensis]MCI1784505.1 hypothetical protein [Schleiferilactobacillus harbinensis]MCI1851109.1 hypothetical protein [Schleiferilactobacillus harbinensis]